MQNAARIGHELTELGDDSPRFARFSLKIVIKKGQYMRIGMGGGGVWYSLFIKNLAHYSSH